MTVIALMVMMTLAIDGLVSPGLLVAEALQAWRPPPRLKLSEWADAHYVLSADAGAAEPGRWHTLPYQREPMDCFTDPRVERITFMKSARVGYTNMLLAAIGYYIHLDPCPMMVIQPTLTDARGFSKESIAPLLRDVPVLAEKFPPHVERKNSLLHKRFAGGLLQLVGARSPASFRRVGRRILFGDEVDDYPPSAGSEGDPIDLAIRRTETFWNRKIATGSTPTAAGASRIEVLFATTDQRRYYVPCPHCGHAAPFVFRRDTGEDATAPRGHFMDWVVGQPATAHFVCQSCGAHIEEHHKRSMIEEADRRQRAGEPGIGWVPHAPFTGHAGFHLWAAYSYSANATWADIAKEAEACAEHPEKRKTFVNTMLGETSKEEAEAPDWEVLYTRRDAYAIGSCPRGVMFLTAGVDVQKDRLVYEVVGWGRDKRSWSIDAHVIPGDTSDTSDTGPWPKLDALLERTFRHEGGAELRITMAAIDSGFLTQTVYGWARRYPLSRVIAIKGTDRAGVLIGSPSKVDVTVRGKKVGYKVWPIAPAIAKSELYGWLKLKPRRDEAGAATDPPGYCRFPELGQDYFKQLTAERLMAQRTAHGFIVYVWTLPENAENHALDCRVYARAAAAVVGLDRFSDHDWAKLENAIGEAPPRPQTPPTTTTPPQAAAPAKPPWIPRRDNWLKKGR